QNKMKKFFTLFFLLKHSLKYFITGTSGITKIPGFVVVAMIDETQYGYCDDNMEEIEPKQDWIKKLFQKKPEHLKDHSKRCFNNQQLFKAYMGVFKQCLNQTEDSHVLQSVSGCEWDDESHDVKGINQYGYDGEDFISLDLLTLTWITPKTQAVVIKHLWDTDKARLEFIKNLYMSVLCPDFLQRTDRPSVSLLQKTPSSPVSCHATGFYPDRADLFWRKDGEEIHEGVEKGGILPNSDGTFQMSSELNISLIKHEDWRKYDCVFQLYGVKEEIIITLNKTEIQTNWGDLEKEDSSKGFCSANLYKKIRNQ
uniref:Ig-like domain-containing protein n=1 Tax=Oryzias melastigma TaxID=30732 RepID=A0A3B3C5L6_ORYME